ncbi:MAG: hypothetical protein QOJ90_2071 [Actinomycetota bacterium]|nr:hypothetical protein [Actinomycetota bacterium]
MTVPVAAGQRASWAELPAAVHVAVAEVLGGQVVEARSQPGGFSPGSADRVVTAGGRRAFVKAVGLELNPDSPGIHRREIAVTAALPREAPAPRLLGSYDDGDWVALVLEDVDGRHPEMPWRRDELHRIVRALADMSRALSPAPPIDVPLLEEDLATEFTAWDRIAADPPADLDPWAAQHLDRLAELGRASLPAVRGDTLLHVDLRADNLLIAADRVVVVDWPWACRGAPWVDLVLFAINPTLYGGHDPDALLERSGILEGVSREAVTSVVAGAAGYFAEACRRPSVARMPTVRAFQRAQGEVCLDWLRRRGI